MHKLNWKRDLPDFRDKRYSNHPTFKIAPLPSSVDLRPQMSPVFDQGQMGSCTSQALAGALEFLELQSLRNKIASAEVIDPLAFNNFSRLFIYYNERFIEGDVDQDGGAQIRDGIKSLVQYGNCSEQSWPYVESHLFEAPTQPVYMEALAHRITSYYRVDNTNLYELKHALVSGFPIIFGFSVYDYFESQNMTKYGVLNVPELNESSLGGHAVVLCGYDDNEKMFWVRNSWGNWGPFSGYFKMSYDYVINSNLCDDFWVIEK